MDISRLRHKLRELAHPLHLEVAPFLSRAPLVKGSIYTWKRRCAKPACRCAHGEKHESVVLTASIGGKTRLWTLSTEHIAELRQQTESYRQFRQARAWLVKESTKRLREILNVIDAIEKARRREL